MRIEDRGALVEHQITCDATGSVCLKKGGRIGCCGRAEGRNPCSEAKKFIGRHLQQEAGGGKELRFVSHNSTPHKLTGWVEAFPHVTIESGILKEHEYRSFKEVVSLKDMNRVGPLKNKLE